MEKDFKNKKIGIWGFGIVGKSALSFFESKGAQISIFDQRNLDNFELALIKNHNAQLIQSSYLPQFLEVNDYIFPSPGIDLTPYKDYNEKWLNEVDLFFQQCTQKVIAVTGSVGKTTTVHMITYLINALGKRAIAAGNIGTGMLDILLDQTQYDYIVLELSSFQLEYAEKCAPHVAVITNIFPNHLDRHKTFDAYCNAKIRIAQGQNEQNIFIAPIESTEYLLPMSTHQIKKWIFPEPETFNINDTLSDVETPKIRNKELITTVIESIELPTNQLEQLLHAHTPLEHRMEFVGTFNKISFYNDSKATIMESTLSALDLINKKPILLLGGLSKGVDRSVYFPQLKGRVKKIVCFGKEASQLALFCKNNSIETTAYKTLEDAFSQSISCAVPFDTILLSPGGSSYDLFKDYQQRGTIFKQLIKNLP